MLLQARHVRSRGSRIHARHPFSDHGHLLALEALVPRPHYGNDGPKVLGRWGGLDRFRLLGNGNNLGNAEIGGCDLPGILGCGQPRITEDQRQLADLLSQNDLLRLLDIDFERNSFGDSALS